MVSSEKRGNCEVVGLDFRRCAKAAALAAAVFACGRRKGEESKWFPSWLMPLRVSRSVSG